MNQDLYTQIVGTVARSPDAHEEAASLRSLATVYHCAARNHAAAGGVRPLIAYRLNEMADNMDADADAIESLARGEEPV